MVDETELTLPTISMPRITALRDKLTAKLMQFAGHQANTEVFQAVVDALVAVMPAGVNKTTVQNSVLSLRGVTLTDDVLFSTCWRLSSSVDRLKLGQAVPAWFAQTSNEWVLCSVVDVFPHKKATEHGVLISFEAITGSPVGMRVTQFWSLRKTGYLAHNKMEGTGYSFGFAYSRNGQPDNVYEYDDARQLYGLRLFMLAVPSHDRDLKLTQVAHTSATMSFNRDILKKRRRELGHFKCPMKYPLNILCHQCPVGRDRCLVACHSSTYIPGNCTKCGKSGVFIDPLQFPEAKAAICVNCNFNWSRK